MSKVFDIYNKINKLKDEELIRRGWIVRKVPGRLESVSEHCFALSNLAILLNIEYNLNLDMEKVLTMINIHEYGEIEAGDIIPKDGISKEDKTKREEHAITHLLTDYKCKNKIIELWEEFEKLETEESIFVYLLDKFQSVLQAKEYSERYQRPELYQEFIDWWNTEIITKEKVKDSRFIKILSLNN